MVRGTNPLALRVGVARTRRSKMPLLTKAPPLSHVLRQAALVDADRKVATAGSSKRGEFARKSHGRRDDVEPRKRAVVTEKEGSRAFSTSAAGSARAFSALAPRNCAACGESCNDQACALCCHARR